MKVRELIERLQEYDPELDILISKDGAGNAFKHLQDISNDLGYNPDDGYYIENIGYLKLTDELSERGFTEEDDIFPEYTPCIVLWP